MRLISPLILLSVIALSCSTKTEKNKPVCWITFNSLFKKLDTSKFELSKDTSTTLFEVLEKPAITGEHGLFKFDTSGHLRFYSFLHDKQNNTNFYIKYDSVGREKRVQYFGGDVLQWNFKKPKPDSIIRMSFLLCELDCNYTNIKIEAGKFIQKHAKPFKTQFLKVVGIYTEFPSAMLDKSRIVYVTGVRQDNCSKQYYNFKDTITTP